MIYEKSLMILLVEDNLLNQRIVTFSLKKFNHEVVIANNGVEAIEHFSERKFDVILMDIMMPVMDGLEATTKIREFEVKNSVKKELPSLPLLQILWITTAINVFHMEWMSLWLNRLI